MKSNQSSQDLTEVNGTGNIGMLDDMIFQDVRDSLKGVFIGTEYTPAKLKVR